MRYVKPCYEGLGLWSENGEIGKIHDKTNKQEKTKLMNVRNIPHSYMARSNSYNNARSLRYQAILVLFRKVSISEGYERRYSVEFTS